MPLVPDISITAPMLAARPMTMISTSHLRDLIVSMSMKPTCTPPSRAQDGLCLPMGTANGDSLPLGKVEGLNAILDGHSDLALCYAMKEEMSRLFELRDSDEALR